MDKSLTITVAVSGKQADARAFANVLDDVLDALDALAKARGVSPDWQIIALGKHSPATAKIGSTRHFSIAVSLLTGMARLESKPKQPFAPSVVRVVKRLADRVGNGTEVSLEVPGRRPVIATPQMAKNAGMVLSKRYYELESSVDGRLDIVNVHAKAMFSIFDDSDNREIRCRFPEHLLTEVKVNIGRRITASGLVRFNRETDLPVSIRIDTIDSFEDDPPQLFSEMSSIDIAAGIASEDLMRRLRDGE